MNNVNNVKNVKNTENSENTENTENTEKEENVEIESPENDWFECTKVVAYYLWEHTGCENALEMWCAAEDIACFFEQANILEDGMITSIKGLGVGSEAYVWFTRNVSYRLYVYTRNADHLTNWYLVEQLMNIPEVVQNLAYMAAMLRSDADATMRQVRSDTVRKFYGKW